MEQYTTVLEESWLDYPDPADNAVLLYMTGCCHHCEGCHSPLLQLCKPYAETYEEIANKLTTYCNRAGTAKVVLLGGDPLHPHNANLTKYLLDTLSNSLDFCIFTGYSIEKVKELQLSGAKYYKCGKFDKNQYQNPQKTDFEYILASKNQNFYDSGFTQISNDGILIFNQ